MCEEEDLSLKKLEPSLPSLIHTKFISSLSEIVFRTHPGPIFHRWSLFSVFLSRMCCAQYKDIAPQSPFQFHKINYIVPRPDYHLQEFSKNRVTPSVSHPLEYPNVLHKESDQAPNQVHNHFPESYNNKFSALVKTIDGRTLSTTVTKNSDLVDFKNLVSVKLSIPIEMFDLYYGHCKINNANFGNIIKNPLLILRMICNLKGGVKVSECKSKKASKRDHIYENGRSIAIDFGYSFNDKHYCFQPEIGYIIKVKWQEGWSTGDIVKINKNSFTIKSDEDNKNYNLNWKEVAWYPLPRN